MNHQFQGMVTIQNYITISALKVVITCLVLTMLYHVLPCSTIFYHGFVGASHGFFHVFSLTAESWAHGPWPSSDWETPAQNIGVDDQRFGEVPSKCTQFGTKNPTYIHMYIFNIYIYIHITHISIYITCIYIYIYNMYIYIYTYTYVMQSIHNTYVYNIL